MVGGGDTDVNTGLKIDARIRRERQRAAVLIIQVLETGDQLLEIRQVLLVVGLICDQVHQIVGGLTIRIFMCVAIRKRAPPPRPLIYVSLTIWIASIWWAM